MGCHNMDTPFFALNLRDVSAVDFESSELFADAAPDWSVITYHFPELNGRAACKLVWYDGRKKPAASLAKMEQLPNNGVIMVGDKDTLFVPSYWGEGVFTSGATVADYKDVPQTLPRVPNGEDNDRAQHDEWLSACKGAGKALSNFDYAGPMTEAVLLGNVAMRVGDRIEWDAKNMKVTNRDDADQYVRHAYRKGWEL
jgi:hypothetical protein